MAHLVERQAELTSFIANRNQTSKINFVSVRDKRDLAYHSQSLFPHFESPFTIREFAQVLTDYF